jgi:tetratricopeptide (TPR) repeat protein
MADLKWESMPIRVFTDAGVAVGSDVVSTAPGEPLQLVFDSSSGSKYYHIYVGSNWPAMHLADSKAGVWLERRQGDGKVINSLPEMLQAWNQSTQVVGRALLNGLSEGGNRFGPQGNLLSHYQGWFELTAPEHLQLGIVSVDATFVLVDGKEVVEWPGQHERWYGASGPPQGAVDLGAGIHSLECYNAYIASPDGNPPMTCSIAAKGGAFPDWTMLGPGTTFFRPVGLNGPSQYELQKDVPGAVASGSAPALALYWVNVDESLIRSDVADVGLIAMRLVFYQPPKGDVTWTFDDGSTAQGVTIEHVFPRPGLRKVHVSVKNGDKEVAALDATIGVHPNWPKPDQNPQLIPEQAADILSRDPAGLPASDLAGLFALFEFYLRTDALAKLAPALCAKMNAVTDPDVAYVEKGAALLAHEDWAHSADQISLLRALIDRCGQGNATPEKAAVASKARLVLARLTFKTSDHLDEVKVLVDAIARPSLTDDEPRVLDLLKADLLLAAGDVPGARKEYVRLTGEPTGPDVRSSIRLTGEIGRARAFLDRKDYDAAEDALNGVAWRAPIEKLAPDWALTRLRLYQEENLRGQAYLWAKRLLPVITDNGRSELLFRLTDLAFAQGDPDLAQKSLSELLKKHPYSEEAAAAKQKWPGKG